MPVDAAAATWYDVAYLDHRDLFILGLKYSALRAQRASGTALDGSAWSIALVATFARASCKWPVIVGGLVVGAAIGIYFGARREDDRDAADGRDLQRLRRRRSGAGRDGRAR